MSKPQKSRFWGPSWPRFSRPLEVLKLPEGVLDPTWEVFRPPLSPKNATLNSISNYSKKNLENPPPKKLGSAAWERVVWGYGEIHNFEKNKVKTYGKTHFLKSAFSQPR